MRILVTNDDGVNSYTLKVLVNVAKKYGEVICIAPSVEQSGKSHSIIIKEPFVIKNYEDIVPGVKTYFLTKFDKTSEYIYTTPFPFTIKHITLYVNKLVSNLIKISYRLFFSFILSAIMLAKGSPYPNPKGAWLWKRF